MHRFGAALSRGLLPATGVAPRQSSLEPGRPPGTVAARRLTAGGLTGQARIERLEGRTSQLAALLGGLDECREDSALDGGYGSDITVATGQRTEASSVYSEIFRASPVLDFHLQLLTPAAVQLVGCELASARTRSVKPKLKYADECENLVMLVEAVAIYARTAMPRSAYRTPHATPEIVFDLVIGCSFESPLAEVLAELAGRERFDRGCLCAGIAIAKIAGACALTDFLTSARDEYDYLEENELWRNPVVREAYLLVLDSGFAAYGALLRGVQSEARFSRTDAFADLDYKLTVVAVESGLLARGEDDE